MVTNTGLVERIETFNKVAEKKPLATLSAKVNNVGPHRNPDLLNARLMFPNMSTVDIEIDRDLQDHYKPGSEVLIVLIPNNS